MATPMGFEPTTSCVTGKRSSLLNYGAICVSSQTDKILLERFKYFLFGKVLCTLPYTHFPQLGHHSRGDRPPLMLINDPISRTCQLQFYISQTL